MGQAAALSGLIGLTGPLAIVLKPPPVTWLGLISANIGYFIYAPFLSVEKSYYPKPILIATAKLGEVPAGRHVVCHVNKIPYSCEAARAETSVANIAERVVG